MISNGPPVCTRCGKEIRAAYDALLTCHSCRTRVWAFEAAAAPWQYRRSGQLAVRAFKYQNRWRIGHWLAQAMVEKACREIPLEFLTRGDIETYLALEFPENRFPPELPAMI
ncbi:MAG: hypothetical protein HYU33_03865, partial [Candidatus Omnitrophica bacterium]|nr:hypothetical protein [Candidatus Omnitrophota bacterium]